ncbi:ATPase [uncultured Photobacterium sp.]|uniref:ATPase n=1 Tax=uncultured Photobacterium sp. TaxID=173973 RepID=UPI002632B37E|nr:ATPase [uncultured Photobacterium sp.]
MQVETLKDVLHWTQEFHRCLADCMQSCVDQSDSERVKLLLKYLAEHEEKLEAVIGKFEKSASENILNTWCYEYFDQHPIIRHKLADCPFSELETDEIISEVTHLHSQVIELYRYLSDRAETESSKELLVELADLEKHEAMRMVHSANRLQDM